MAGDKASLKIIGEVKTFFVAFVKRHIIKMLLFLYTKRILYVILKSFWTFTVLYTEENIHFSVVVEKGGDCFNQIEQ